MASEDDTERHLAEYEAKVAEIERAHHREMLRYQSNLMVYAVLGIPLAVGAVSAVFVALKRGLGDLPEVAVGIGATLGVGLAIAVVGWLGMRAWARWIN